MLYGHYKNLKRIFKNNKNGHDMGIKEKQNIKLFIQNSISSTYQLFDTKNKNASKY